MTYKMFIDDERDPPNGETDWIVKRCFTSAMHHIYYNGCPNYISFDHDLATHLTGYDVAKEIVMLDMHGEVKIPDDFSFYVHSQNPVGAKNIQAYLDNYLSQRAEKKPRQN